MLEAGIVVLLVGAEHDQLLLQLLEQPCLLLDLACEFSFLLGHDSLHFFEPSFLGSQLSLELEHASRAFY